MKKKGVPDISNHVMSHAVQFFMGNKTNQVVHKGKIVEATLKFGVSRRFVQNIWVASKQQMSEGKHVLLSSKKLGQPSPNILQLDMQKIKSIPHLKRNNIRSLAHELQLSKITVGRWVKRGAIRAHSNAIKSSLTERNKLQRISFTLNALTIQPKSRRLTFSEMYNVVHIDEKWFYMAKDSERYYVLPDEDEPYRECKSKRYIPKIMFMCVVARPRNLTEEGSEFDGKFGIWLFTTKEPVARNSKNRAKVTLVTKPIDFITKEVTKRCIINQVIPAIKAKWPPNADKTIFIQQDNAKPHISMITQNSGLLHPQMDLTYN